MSNLPTYLQAAERKHGDPEAIFETATAELEPVHLARLVRRLRDTHPAWKLAKRCAIRSSRTYSKRPS